MSKRYVDITVQCISDSIFGVIFVIIIVSSSLLAHHDASNKQSEGKGRGKGRFRKQRALPISADEEEVAIPESHTVIELATIQEALQRQ